MKAFFKKWWHGLLALYTFIYMPCFLYLERHVTSETGFHAIHCALDDHIPFVEYFIIPYYSWFIFMAFFIIYFFIRSQGECVRMGAALIIGMSIAVIIYFVFPNGLADFRPETFPRDNFCTDLVKLLHKADTPTNVLPSLHVYNTLVIEFAVFNSKTFGRHKKSMYHNSNLGLINMRINGFLKTAFSIWRIGCNSSCRNHLSDNIQNKIFQKNPVKNNAHPIPAPAKDVHF